MTNMNMPQYVSDFFEAVNRQDEAAFLDFFAPDGFVDDWGHVYIGRASIKDWSDKQLIGAHGVFAPQKVTTKDDAVTVTGDYRSDHINGLNAFTFRRRGGDLISVTIRKGWRAPRLISSARRIFRPTTRGLATRRHIR